MPQHLHNRDAAVFMAKALLWLHDNGAPLRKQKSHPVLLWQQGAQHALVPLAAAPSIMPLTARLHALAAGETIAADERISLMLTRFHNTHRMRVAFTLSRQHGETTLTITEHMTQTNSAAPPGKPGRTRIYASEIYYDDGPFRKMPEATLALFQEFVAGPDAPALDPPSPFKRELVAKPFATGRYRF